MLCADAAIECQRKMDPDDRDKIMRYMVKHMGRFLIDLSRCVRYMMKHVGRFLIDLSRCVRYMVKHMER